MTGSFEAFVDEIAATGKFVFNGDWSFYFDPDAFARRWRGLARGKLSVLSYDRVQAKAGVIPTFLSRIGAPEPLIELGRNAEVLNVGQPVHIPAEHLRNGTARLRALRADRKSGRCEP